MTDKKYKFTVSEEQNLKRVDQFIVEELPTFSRTKISKLIKEGALLVNNEPIEERSKKVSFGDEVSYPCQSQYQQILNLKIFPWMLFMKMMTYL